jgi:hypothetical protein
MGRPLRDLTGQTFGRLTVVSRGADYVSPKGKHVPMWTCECSCGGSTDVQTSILLRGATKSCGCLQRDLGAPNKTHGLSGTDRYVTYRSMIARCYNENAPAYKHYGGRGIRVCDRWRGPGGFENYLSDLGPKPWPGATVDRELNDGPYSPDNCRWATRIEQARNTRSTLMLDWQGGTQSLRTLADQFGIDAERVANRIFKHGWSVERALTTPVRPMTKRAA